MRFWIFICILALTGCTGSAYELPEVKEAELQAMQKKVAKHKIPPKMYERSDSKYRKMLASINNRLIENAQPLCDYADYSSCFFQTMYSKSDDINAYASDDYKITMNRGLLQYLESEDEIAAVLAHEMGHHLAHHNDEDMGNMVTGAAVASMMGTVLFGMTNTDSSYDDPYQQQQNDEMIEDMVGLGAEIGALSYSKEQEREADLLAVYLLSRAGYDLERAKNLMMVFAKMPDEKTETSFMDTHPASIERLVAWEKATEEVRANPSKLPYAKSDEEFESD